MGGAGVGSWEELGVGEVTFLWVISSFCFGRSFFLGEGNGFGKTQERKMAVNLTFHCYRV